MQMIPRDLVCPGQRLLHTVHPLLVEDHDDPRTAHRECPSRGLCRQRRGLTGASATQDGDSLGRTHDRAESKEALRSPPASVAACLAVVKKASADSFASLTASTV